MNCIVFINQYANNLTGWSKWLTIKEELKNILPCDNYKVFSYAPPFDVLCVLKEELKAQGETLIISGGGDGTHNVILNALMSLPNKIKSHVLFGAIGLGSSNDFMKPSKKKIKGIPVRLNMHSICRHDIGKLSFIDDSLQSITKYFIINASLGIVAEANYLFNKGDWFINRTKHKHVSLTINYTALKTLIKYRKKRVLINCDGTQYNINLNNLSVVKNPFVSGSFQYDQNILPDDNFLGLNYCHNMSRFEVLRVMSDLEKGIFRGAQSNSKRISTLINTLEVYTEKNLAIETDGEVYYGTQIKFSLSSFKLKVLGQNF